MAKISLRAYNHEIETLIERGHTEEAIAHCKYILKTYPKHLDTYRLLGKAFLESQRYSEAGDILQRILSVQPDDFVAQIGMSIIREDEGNLDAAIYHMERAFEIQPSNAAIQDELRRLYGRRDGMEPSKLRLTRGALVRMYARGDLYRQAIAEARAAIVEDPQRLDLEIVLARMYYQTGQKAEAAEICSRLVSKLPFCLEANRILADVLPETSRSEDAKIYQQRLVAMEPYLAYLSETALDIQQVPENAITLDRLEWMPSIETDQQPTWAKSLGIQIEEKTSEKVPDWLAEIPATPRETAAETETAQPFSEEPSLFENQVEPLSAEASTTPAPAALPEWMETVGWSISDQPAKEQPEIAPQIPYDEGETLAAAPADIPDWLKEMAPTDSEPVLAGAQEDQQNLDWLSSILSPETPIAEEKTGEGMPPALNEAVEPPAAVPTIEATPAFSDELPEWMKGSSLHTDETVSVDQSQEPLPDWLIEPAELQPAPTLEMPLPQQAEITQPQEPAATEPIGEAQVEEPIPAAEMAHSEDLIVPPAAETPPAPDLENMDEAMAWLESLAAKQGAEEETLLTRPEDRLETTPEWISQTIQPEKAAELPTQPEVPPVEEIEPIEEPVIPFPAELGEISLPELTQEPAAYAEPETTSSIPEEPQVAPQEILPQTLAELEMPAELTPIQPAAVIELPVEQLPGLPGQNLLAEENLPVESTLTAELPPQPTVEANLPVEQVQPEATVELPQPEEQIQVAEPTPESTVGAVENQGEIDMDAAFAWLESLASKQGAEAESLLVAPEERKETPPDWVQQQAVSVEEPPVPTELESEAPLPDWMKAIEVQLVDEVPATDTPASPNEPLPDWLIAIESTPEASRESTSAETEPGLSQAIAEELAGEPAAPSVTPDWIQGFEEINEEKTTLIPESGQPALIEPASSAEVIPPLPSQFGKTHPLPSWMVSPEQLPAAETQTTAEGQPAEQPLPDWLQAEISTEVVPEALTAVPQAETTPALPDWLKNLEAEQEETMPEEPVMTVVPETVSEAIEISSDPDIMIGQAQTALDKGQIDLALSAYVNLIQKDQHVADAIHDLRDALYRYPVDSSIWQTLGDAYMRHNRLQDALDAYTKAEELLK